MDSQGIKSKRGRPPSITPPHGKKKSKENELQVCIICELNIKEDTDQTEGEDALFCEGDCQAWVHRKCVGMSKKMYTAWAEADDPYMCHNCSICTYKNEIKSLKTKITDLKSEVKSLTSKVNELKSSGVSPSVDSSDGNDVMVTDNPIANPAIDAIHTQLKEITSSIKNHQKFIEQNDRTDRTKPDRKYNVVVYGIKECPSGTPISERNRHDINESLSIFFKIGQCNTAFFN